MSSFDDKLSDIRRAHGRDPTDLGRAFEKMTKIFLENDNHYKSRFKKIEMWNKWQKDNDINKHDDGIDLVGTEMDGSLCAIQCKCLDDNDKINKDVINSVSGAAKVYKMKEKMLVYTCGITSNAARFAEKHCVQLLSSETLRDRPIDWTKYPKIKPTSQKELYRHQVLAFNDVINGMKNAERGKLIMACGTGKTLTSLRIAEHMVPKGGMILYLVPSITLIQQTMQEWAENTKINMYFVAACSDKGVSDQGSTTDVESRVSTDPTELKRYIDAVNDKTTVIFSTYHSIEQVAKSVKNKTIDMIFCDEAHKTVGGAVKIGDSDKDSYYTFVHENSNIRAKKRIYMTATPRVFTDAIKKSAKEKKRIIYTMDDEEQYGKTLHELTFADAVHTYKKLADYKVKIAVIPEDDLPLEVQQRRAEDGTIELTKVGKMIAAWDGIRNPEEGKDMLQRVIVFSNLIRDSKAFTGQIDNDDPSVKVGGFERITGIINSELGINETARTRHVDGTTSARDRKKELRWLSESNNDPTECRLLSNAKCLSEGVDVPALDGIVFMDPRTSVVDVVQSVGRVMRRPAKTGKKYGYVIIPVVIPAGMNPEESMDDNDTWKVVWQVLNALRSHDPRLAMDINRLILDKGTIKKKITEAIEVTPIGGTYTKTGDFLENFYSKLATKIVEKVGDINYFDEYGERIGEASIKIEERIIRFTKSKKSQKIITDFNESLKRVVSNKITIKDTINVVSQHMVLSRVFERLFEGKFKSQNPVAWEFEQVVRKLNMPDITGDLEGFYRSVDAEIDKISSRHARQEFIKRIYGNFFAVADKKRAARHGVVYTPIECIDFIIKSVEEILQNNFKNGLNTRGIKILEPFAGTGTFITRLLESGLITSNFDIKYSEDISANELILLAHYISTVNIETTYQSLSNKTEYVPFSGMSYTDTLNLNPRHFERPDLSMVQTTIDADLPELDKRVKKQRELKIDVIIGNPPYSAGQKSFNDENPNVVYPNLDERIEETYGRSVHGKAKGQLRDSYIRSIRWMSDRVSECGVIAIITNGSFMRSSATSGMRDSLVREFDEIWCLDLRGNMKHKEWRKEGGKIFGSNSQAPVAIVFLIKKQKRNTPENEPAKIFYKDIGDWLDRDQKITRLKEWESISGIKDWVEIIPDRHNDWLDQRNEEFYDHMPIGSKDVKAGKISNGVFREYSNGIKTNRDVWAYNSSRKILEENMRKHIEYYNDMDPKKLKLDPTRGKWTGDLTEKRLKNEKLEFDYNRIYNCYYRPFFKQFLYFDRILNNAVYRIPQFFPTHDTKNLAIVVPLKFTGNFSTIITDKAPDLELIHHGQCFPLYTYDNGVKKDNILDSTLEKYRNHYNDPKISKEDIFYYVYGLLHHPKYKAKYADALTRELPHIPLAPNFVKFRDVGKKLAKLHLGHINGKIHSLNPKFIPENQFRKLSWGKKKIKASDKKEPNADKTVVRIDGHVLYENLPDTKYKVNCRSPLGWIIDRYKITKNKESGIINDPCTKVDICSIIEMAVHIAVKSDEIIDDLPDEFESTSTKEKTQNSSGLIQKNDGSNISLKPRNVKKWNPKRGGLDKFSDTKSYNSTLV